MKPTKRLLDPDSDATEAERRLLDAARPADPPTGARERVAARLARTVDATTPATTAATSPGRKVGKTRRGNGR